MIIQLYLRVCANEDNSTFLLKGGLKAPRRTFNSGPPTRKLPSHLLFCVHLAVLSFPVSRLKPLSSSCEIALNKLSLAAIGAVFCHFEGSQWSAQEPLSTLIYTPPHGGHTLILYDVSKSFRPASGCPGIGVTSQSLILTPLREDGGKFRWFGGCPLCIQRNRELEKKEA